MNIVSQIQSDKHYCLILLMGQKKTFIILVQGSDVRKNLLVIESCTTDIV